MENFEEALKFTHCDCGEKLVFFEKLEDSYTETVNQPSDNESSERPKNETTRETLANGKKYTEKKASQYKIDSEKGNSHIFAGICILIIGLITGLFISYFLFLLVFIGGFLVVYGNSLNETGKEKGYSWQKGLEGENLVLIV